ncbi:MULTISPECIES: family 20 glycosylhydrolase [Clostridium]|uniref:Uncharacterized protein n=1 Tax=Clostridium cadaveris TaxID=1529 RepID=A0A316M890_9CLOT|nr:family 20 glycosylhydrolase [Clostridium cadaveris]MDU4952691.1 family 20 glycosylhydrolase [Clostridium sp.]NME64901.1 family 20 glycosylhydrolase [Clostridium cadaveris]PWL53908.1 MAG: hypothetical protein DBY38_05805 [Clostridium cadaveris]UFH65246.1 family 20 glycosylhydrolase [Clostridium cadaveris]
MKRIVASVLSAAMILSTFGNVTYAKDLKQEVIETKTYPQVQSYTAEKSGYWSLKNTSRFYIVESDSTLNNEKLYNDVKLISSEFAANGLSSNGVLDIVIGPKEKIKSGDIVVSIEKIEETSNEEGYKIEVKEDVVKITAANENGLFYGMRTVEKALIGNDGKMQLGTIVDYPEMGVRSFHLDLARKYFTKDWIISMIKDLSYQNISSIQIHFSENEGFRLESSVLENKIPGFEYPSNGYYTKADMKEIIDVAKKYHIEVIPSLDTPGHLGYVLNQLESKTGKDYSVRNLFPSDSRRNQTFNIFESEEAQTFLLEMIDEFAKFFSENGSTRMNIGGDEFLANFTSMSNEQYQTLMGFFNKASETVKKYGMKARAWNDGLLVQGYDGYKLDSDIEVCYWGLGKGSAPVKDFLKNGNKLVNYVDAYMYYALSPWWMNNANPKGEKIYKQWEPGKMNGLPGGISQDFEYPYPNQLLGASYALWCDMPNYQTEQVIAENLYMRTRSMAAKTWNPKGNKADYAEFEQFAKKVGRVPGYDKELPAAKDVVHVDELENPTLNGKQLSSLVLPIVQSYEVSEKSKSWTMDETTRFVIPKTEEYLSNVRLKEVVELVSAEFLEKQIPTNKEIDKVYDLESKVTSNDVVVTIDKENPITEKSNSDEAYKIEISDKGVKIVAASENAAMYALRTIQHLMINNNNKLTYGTIVDYPNVAERRVHVDMARKYISKDWIIQHIRELSYFKMNAIQLHFSENIGFRIESDFDPAIVSKDGYLTKKEIREILKEAKKYGINVIPSLDTPGHVQHILKVHPEYGQVDKYGNKSTVALDVTNPDAIKYIKGLYKEYMDLFEGCTDFHIGGDEYMEFDRPPFTTQYKSVLDNYAKEKFGQEYTWKDTMANYINDIAAFVHEGGFKPRIWNDGIYYGENSWSENKQQIKMHDYIGIDFWSQMGWNPSIARLETFIKKGHKDIYNVNASFFYYVLRPSKPNDGREQHSFDYLNQDQRIYNEWTPGQFQGNTIDDNSEVIGGASLAIWCDKPDLVTEDVITADISKELRSLASKSWNTSSNKIATIDEFKENYKKLGNVAAFKKGSSLPEVKPVKEVVELTYNELNQLIEKVEGLNGDDYTKESFDNLNEVLKEAKALLGAAKTQEEIDSMVSKLKDSINNLKIKEDGNGDNETPSVPGTPGNSNKPENEGSNNIENSPKTGDEFGPWGIVAISTVILGSVIMYRKRNKKVV